MASHNEPLRWGIIGTGLISSWFTKDITTARKSPAATHIIQAIGSSSLEKAHAFITAHLPSLSPKPTIHPTYHAVYADPAVDIIYIGTRTACTNNTASMPSQAGSTSSAKRPSR
ncbi:hypothetical protein BDW62DRAFT_176512 [Aspergillus aurantiobrunneus]